MLLQLAFEKALSVQFELCLPCLICHHLLRDAAQLFDMGPGVWVAHTDLAYLDVRWLAADRHGSVSAVAIAQMVQTEQELLTDVVEQGAHLLRCRHAAVR